MGSYMTSRGSAVGAGQSRDVNDVTNGWCTSLNPSDYNSYTDERTKYSIFDGAYPTIIYYKLG